MCSRCMCNKAKQPASGDLYDVVTSSGEVLSRGQSVITLWLNG